MPGGAIDQCGSCVGRVLLVQIEISLFCVLCFVMCALRADCVICVACVVMWVAFVICVCGVMSGTCVWCVM